MLNCACAWRIRNLGTASNKLAEQGKATRKAWGVLLQLPSFPTALAGERSDGGSRQRFAAPAAKVPPGTVVEWGAMPRRPKPKALGNPC